MSDEEKAEEYLIKGVCQGCSSICEGDCAYAKPVRQAYLDGLAEGRKGREEWIDFSKFDFADDTFKHFLFRLEDGRVYCGYMKENVADGDCYFGITYFKDNSLKSETDWAYIDSIDGSKITHFMQIEKHDR